MPIRRLGVTLSELVDDQTYQLSFFEDQERTRSLKKQQIALKNAMVVQLL